MSFRVRTGRADDLPSIIPWTTDTFSWGDYVPERIAGWLEDPNSALLVCAGDGDVVRAIVRAEMLSADEGWLAAARVHPEHRREGMGTALNHAGVDWLREHGAQVVRLAIEADNAPAMSQVERLGYRQVSRWAFAWWDREHVEPAGRGHELQRAHGQDVDAAWISWSTSDLAVAARDLVPQGWRWRRGRPGDLESAVSTGALRQSPLGWAVVEEIQDDGKTLEVNWVSSEARDLPHLLDALLGLAGSSDAGLYLKIPALPWAAEAMERAGARISETLVYERPV